MSGHGLHLRDDADDDDSEDESMSVSTDEMEMDSSRLDVRGERQELLVDEALWR